MYIFVQNEPPGTMVTTVTATDRDKDIVTYYFRRPNGEFTSDTPEFHLDPNSGIITTRKPLDREDTPSYTVRLGQYLFCIKRILNVTISGHVG